MNYNFSKRFNIVVYYVHDLMGKKKIKIKL